jgi:hypothetical protein
MKSSLSCEQWHESYFGGFIILGWWRSRLSRQKKVKYAAAERLARCRQPPDARQSSLMMEEKPKDEWSVEEWVAFMQGKAKLA